MDPNMTPTSNRSWRADTPQQEQQSPFQGTIDLKYQAQRMKDYEFFVTPHDHLTGIELEVTKKLTEDIKKHIIGDFIL